MLSLQLSLDFACCLCGRSVGITLSCAGDGLKALHPTAVATLACPNCGQRLQVEFLPYQRRVLKVAREPLPLTCHN